jgi:DNA-binding NarL/FixJ family response regulator
MTTSDVRRCRVYVVDNNIDLAQTLAEVIGLEPDLECVGFSCSGADALERAVAAGADIMVLDFSLPGRNALSVLDESKAKGARIDILIFTGHAGPDFALEARARGAAGYLVKGGPFAELAAEIRRIYGLRDVTSD